MYTESKRLEFLDSIRGLAALAVLLSHTLFAFVWPPGVSHFINLPLVNVFFDGKGAVAMFFVLSGFVLSRPYVVPANGKPPRQIFLPTFYLRRLTRIWLPWLGAFGASALAQRFFFQAPITEPPTTAWLDQFWHVPVTLENFLRQSIFVLHDNRVQLLNQDWSLGIELKGSALIPLFVLLASGWRMAGLVSLGFALLFGLPTGCFYVSFILGILLAKYHVQLLRWLQPWSAISRSLLLLTGLFFYEFHHVGMSYLRLPAYENYYWCGTSIGCVLILLGCLSSHRLQRLLNRPVPVFLGRISYSVYLLQFIVILCVLPPFVRCLNVLGFDQPILLLPLTVIVSVGLTAALSAINYRLVEMPCIQLGHNLTAMIQRRLGKT